VSVAATTVVAQAGIAQFSRQEPGEIGVTGPDFIKTQQAVAITILGKQRAEDDYVICCKPAQGFRCQGIAAGTVDSLRPIGSHNRGFQV
jgi:hypothetical protein